MRLSLCFVLFVLLFSACAEQKSDQTDTVKNSPASHSSATKAAVSPEELVFGQTVYVPVYSHIYYGNDKNAINLAANLSIRNTDPSHPMIVTAVEYYDSDGKIVRKYADQPLQLAPMASLDYMVEEKDTAGGVGANFLVKWGSKIAVTEPIVEAVMITTKSSQGISFLSTGRVIEERPAKTHDQPPTDKKDN